MYHFCVFSEFVALSNMPKRKSTALDDGWTRSEFETTPIMSTYLLAFVVAEFRERKKTVGDLTVSNIGVAYTVCRVLYQRIS